MKETFRAKYISHDVSGLITLHEVVQRPGENVSDFIGRLKRAACPLYGENNLEDIKKKNLGGKELPSELLKYAPEIVATVKDRMYSLLYHHFMKGLNANIRDHLSNKHPKDFNEALMKLNTV